MALPFWQRGDHFAKLVSFFVRETWVHLKIWRCNDFLTKSHTGYSNTTSIEKYMGMGYQQNHMTTSEEVYLNKTGIH